MLPIRTRRLRCCGSTLTVTFSHRYLIAFFAFIATVVALRSAAGAQAFIIVDSQTGYILQSEEPRKKRQVGSLTKIATASVVPDWAEHFGSQLGSQMTSVDAFVTQMNALAKQLKMERTRFVNPHGVDDKVRPMPFSTAEDMARLTRYAMNKASFRFYVSQKQRQISFDRSGHQLNYMLRNTNELLGKMGVDGVKTGRTARAGDCLILTANREPEIVTQGKAITVYPRHLIVVLLGSTNRFGEGAGLVQRGWQLYDQWAAGGRLAD